MTEKKIADISAMDFLTKYMKKYQCFKHKFMTYDQSQLEIHLRQSPHYVTDTIQCNICSQFVKVKTRLLTLEMTRIIQTTCDRCKNLNVSKVFK